MSELPNPEPDLSKLTIPQVETALNVVSLSLMLSLPPEMFAPPQLQHLSEMDWDSLFWAHETLMYQKEISRVH